MKFDMTGAQHDREIAVGDVFRARGPGRTRYWIVLAIVGSSLHMAGIDAEGSIVSTASYGAHAMEFRERVGTCRSLEGWTFCITWEPPR